MRRLRYFGITLLGSAVGLSLACRPVTIIQDDDDGVASSSSGGTTVVTPDDTSSGTTEVPSDDTTGTSGSGSGSSEDTGPQGQACGNGIIEGTEQCDCGGMPCSPAGLNDAMCLGQTQLLPTGETRYYTGGILDCNPASCQFLYTQCAFCGDENLNGMELCEEDDEGPSCQTLGMGTSNEPLPCAPSCLEWDTTCCAMPLPKECQ